MRSLLAGVIGMALISAAVFTVALSFGKSRINFTAPVAAYLLPVGNVSVIRTSAWQGRTIHLPLAIRSGEEIRLPEKSRVRLVSSKSAETAWRDGPLRFSQEEKSPSEPNFLVSPLPEVVAAAKAAVGHATGEFVITSPAGVTRFLNPEISWTAQPGVDYDVAVVDSADPYVPPRVAQKVRPPIALASLETPQRRQLGPDRNYEIAVRESDAVLPSGATRCLTLTDAKLEAQLPSEPADLALEALTAMAKKPYRTGDAWLALSRLPPEWAGTELGLRLRLAVAVELGHKEMLARAIVETEQFLNSPRQL